MQLYRKAQHIAKSTKYSSTLKMNAFSKRFCLQNIVYYYKVLIIQVLVLQQAMISNVSLSTAFTLVRSLQRHRYHYLYHHEQKQHTSLSMLTFQSELSPLLSQLQVGLLGMTTTIFDTNTNSNCNSVIQQLPPVVNNVNITSNLLLQSITGLLTYLSLIAFYDRPRGKLQIHPSSFQLKHSQVPNAGLGLYLTQSLPQGTILGTYPGVLRPASKYIQKYNSIPNAAVYTWRFTDNQYCIDPTNQYGQLEDICYGGTSDYPLSYILHESLLRVVNVPTLLARINEPPLGGGGCNVMVTEDLERREVVFELSRDVMIGEELFMDYGLTYDRSSYQ